MMHKAGRSIEEVPCSFSRWSVNFQGHMGQKIAKMDPNCAFPDCNFRDCNILTILTQNSRNFGLSAQNFFGFELESPNLHLICILGFSQLVLKMGGIDLDLQGHLAILTHKTAFNIAFVLSSRPAKGCYTYQTCSCLDTGTHWMLSAGCE